MMFLVSLILVPIGASHAEEAVVRQGFTFGLSVGAGAAFLNPKTGDSKNDGGLGGINVMIGGFLNPDLALVLKAAGVNYGPFDSQLSTGIAGVAGPAVEYWLSDHFNLVGGVGVGLISMEDNRGFATMKEAGFGGMVSVNYFPWALKHHGLGFSIDLTPIFTSNYSILTYQAGFSWQYY
jgi:hypothetical protein